ncbi:MAG: MFS transporter, partial [Chloroflexota bacterium]
RSSLALRVILSNTPLMIVLVIAFVGQFGLGLLQGTFALYSEAILFAGESEETVNLGVGLLLAVVGVGQLLTQTVLLKRLLARFGDLWLVFAGSIIRSLGLVIFAIFTTPLLGAFGSLFFAIGMGLLMPPLQSLTTQTVPDSLRGGALGVYQSSVSLATIVSTAVAGTIFAINPTMPFWVGALLSLLALVPALLLAYQIRQKKAVESGVAAD